MSVFSSILSSASGFLGGLADKFTGGFVNEYFNKRAESRQFDRDVQMWNMNNEYNKPANAVARLRDAGLNPQLALGGSSIAGGSTLGGSSSIASAGAGSSFDSALRGEVNSVKKKNEAEIENIENNNQLIKNNSDLTKAKIDTEKKTQENIAADTDLKRQNTANLGYSKEGLADKTVKFFTREEDEVTKNNTEYQEAKKLAENYFKNLSLGQKFKAISGFDKEYNKLIEDRNDKFKKGYNNKK